MCITRRAELISNVSESMTYDEAVAYLFASTPVYQHVGGQAYKPGLDNVERLDAHYGHPHRAYHIIHVGGTNGKGSTSSTLAAVLQASGYRVGLFTSPHLIDFRERIRVNGELITQGYVTRFTEEAREQIADVQPSFFELTTMMALCYFRDQEVDVAVVEVGLGGRLDSTNIVKPIVSVITNISLDHTQYLGNTLAEIAVEKAGIIKSFTPVVIGSAEGEGVRQVFDHVAQERNAPLVYAAEQKHVIQVEQSGRGGYRYHTDNWGTIEAELGGIVQVENACTIFATLQSLEKYMLITKEAVCYGFAHVKELTGLRGRWECLSKSPLIICDTAHNEVGIRGVVQQLVEYVKERGMICVCAIIGVAADKDVDAVLRLWPRDEHFSYIFTQAQVSRALPATEFAKRAYECGLKGEVINNVPDALTEAVRRYVDSPDILIFVGGSNFVVADLLSSQAVRGLDL